MSGLLLLILGTFLIGQVGGAPEIKFATGVGGLAIVALFLGLRRFDTVRAAVSLSVGILAIGVLTFPGAREIVGEENVAAIVGFLGAVIGVNGAAEASVQIAAARQGASAENARRAGDAGLPAQDS